MALAWQAGVRMAQSQSKLMVRGLCSMKREWSDSSASLLAIAVGEPSSGASAPLESAPVDLSHLGACLGRGSNADACHACISPFPTQ